MADQRGGTPVSGRRPRMTVEERRTRNKYLEYTRARGVSMYVDNGPMVEHIRELNKYISRAWIAERAGLSEAFMHDHLVGRIARVHVDRHNAVMAVQLTAAERITNEDRFRGAQRIVQGLIARGFTQKFLADYLPIREASLANLCCGTDRGWYGMSREHYAAFIQLAEKFDACDPRDYGIPARGVQVNLTNGARKGWAPLACWDLDTIHAEESFPDWTGECGTVQGYYLHLRHDIQVKNYKHGSKTRINKQRRYVECIPCLGARKRETKATAIVIPRKPVLDALDGGMTIRAASAHFGCSTRTVLRIKRESEDGS